MKLTKTYTKSELDDIIQLYPTVKKIIISKNGVLLSCETDDTNLITYLQGKGFT
jgi:hypothetical protein